MQTLVQGLANKPDSAQQLLATPPEKTDVVSGNDGQQQAVLLEMLTNIQNTLEANRYQTSGQPAASSNKLVSQSINQSLQSEKRIWQNRATRQQICRRHQPGYPAV